jgi:hypothetical protein
MNASLNVPAHAPNLETVSRSRLPIVRLLHPRRHAWAAFAALLAGLALGAFAVGVLKFPAWTFTAIVLATLLPIGIVKWREDALLFGSIVAMLGILLTVQGVHTIEHVVQWAQYHVLFWTARQSSGLVSAANAGWVNFVWNWSVLRAVLFLVVKGRVRNVWAYLLLAVAALHAVEHTYTFVRHVQVLEELRQFGVTNLTAQGLPGIVGRDGWLARSSLTQGTFLCSLPGLTTAIRLDVHFWWNAIEMVLLLAAAHVFLRRVKTPM